MCQQGWLQRDVSENSPISLFPNSPHGVDESTTSLPSLFLRDSGEHVIPPGIDAMAKRWRGHANVGLPSKNLLANHRGEATTKKEVMHRLWVNPTQLAYWIMRPSPNCQIIRREDLAMNGQPCKEATFGLRLCLPNLCSLERCTSALKLAKVSRGRRVLPIRRPSPSNRIRVGKKHHSPNDVPK